MNMCLVLTVFYAAMNDTQYLKMHVCTCTCTCTCIYFHTCTCILNVIFNKVNTVPPFLLVSASSTSVSCLFTSCSTTAIHNDPTLNIK